jgi:hypothetical protein
MSEESPQNAAAQANIQRSLGIRRHRPPLRHPHHHGQAKLAFRLEPLSRQISLFYADHCHSITGHRDAASGGLVGKEVFACGKLAGRLGMARMVQEEDQFS